MKKFLLPLSLLILVLIIPMAYSNGYWDWLTKGRADTLYCQLYGDCTLANLTVLGGFFNLSVTNIYINVTELFGEHWVNETGDTMTGNLDIENANISAEYICDWDGETYINCKKISEIDWDVTLQDAYDAGSTIIIGSGLTLDIDLTGGGAFNIIDTSEIFIVNQASGEIASIKWVPLTDDTFDFGSPTQRWKDGYFSGTIYSGETGETTKMSIKGLTGEINISNSSIAPKFCIETYDNCISDWGDASKWEEAGENLTIKEGYNQNILVDNITIGSTIKSTKNSSYMIFTEDGGVGFRI